MGLSSSQARLLTLTSRMHQIEYKAARLEAQKLQLANKSNRVYEDYLAALDAAKIQYSVLSADGSINYVDATYNSLIAAGYTLRFIKPVIDEGTLANYATAGGNKNYFIALESGRVTAASQVVTDDDGTEWTEIYTAEQLQNISSSGNYRLMSDIDLSGYDWSSVSSFSGTFDGNGYTISGLSSALFDSLSGASVYNLNLSGDIDTVDSAADSTGMLANNAYSGTTVSNVSVSGSINAYSTAGGLIGYVAGDDTNEVVISNCSSSVTVFCEEGSAGGLCGVVEYASITNCSASGDVTGEYRAGGLCGWVSYASITNCSASGNVTTTGTSGTSPSDSAGGLLGYVQYSDVTDCSASGDVTGLGSCSFAGGLVGCAQYECNISGTASGDVSGTYYTDQLIAASYKITSSVDTGAAASAASPSISVTTALDDIIADDYTVVGYTKSSELFDDITSSGYILYSDYAALLNGHGDDAEWLANMVNEGYLYIYVTNSCGELVQTSVATDTGLQEVSDETALKKAEAQYEADMKKIDLKDTKYDTDLAAIETERQAIESEIDTLKTVASDNADRTFKLFS